MDSIYNNSYFENSTVFIDSTPPIISDYVLKFFQIVIVVIIGQALVIFGCITNIINMIIFQKIGFKETINYSLFAVAVSDFGSTFAMEIACIFQNPWFINLNLPFDYVGVAYILSGWNHTMFIKITTLITAFITVERCLCVTMPLKVKTIITHKRVKIFLVSVFATVLLSYVPIYYSTRLEWRFFPSHNRTFLGTTFVDNKEARDKYVLAVHIALFSYAALVIIIVATGVLAIKLRRIASWRVTMANAHIAHDVVAAKEKRCSKMVLTISILFMCCFTPSALLQLATSLNNAIYLTGKEVNLLMLMSYMTVIMELINSSINIFIYYNNSTVYRTVFDQLFCSRRITKTKT